MKYEVFHKQLNLFKMWDGASKVPSQSLVIDSFNSLRKAVEWMEAFDLLCYSPKIAVEYKLPALITEMTIIAKGAEIVVSKSYLYANPTKSIVEGVYLLVNSEFIPPEDFLKLNKLDISSLKNPNGDGKTFLVASKNDLEKMQRSELRMRAAQRSIRSLPGQGIGLN